MVVKLPQKAPPSSNKTVTVILQNIGPPSVYLSFLSPPTLPRRSFDIHAETNIMDVTPIYGTIQVPITLTIELDFGPKFLLRSSVSKAPCVRNLIDTFIC